MNNLLIIESPLQLINCYSYLKKHNDSLKKTHIIFIGQDSSSFSHIKKITNFFNMNSVSIVLIKKKSLWNLIKAKKNIHKLLRNRAFDCILIGDGRNILAKTIANKTPSKNIILVDDGAASLFNPGLSNLSFLKKIILTICGFSLVIRQKFIYYSVYSILNNNKLFLFEKNDYSFMQGIKIESNLEAYIIGQPLYEANIFSNKNDYISLVKNLSNDISTYHPNHKIIYIPHIRESTETTKLIEGLNIAVLKLNYPIELEFFMNRTCPKLIFGFYSSALYNLSIIYSDYLEIYYKKLPEKKINKLYLEEICQVYKGFERLNCHMLP